MAASPCSGKVVAMVRWVLPRDNEGPQPGSEKGRWPEFPDDVDRSLADPLFESMARVRKEIMEDRRHYRRSQLLDTLCDGRCPIPSA